MEPLAHDPKTKKQIKDAIYGLLYDPIEKHLKGELDKIIVKNAVIGGYTHKSFMHKNIFYTCDPAAPPRKMNRLMVQMLPEMNAYLAELKQLNEKEVP